MLNICKQMISISIYLGCFRIVRNKAAEKAKISGYGSGGCTSPDLAPGLTHEGHTSLRHPSYSINGILGIHQQQDANANIQSRKREAEGKCVG